jgi:nucleoside phosphorylase
LNDCVEVFIFVALPCEAKPLVQHWGLKKSINHHAYTIYSHAGIHVVVTGIGKVAMAGGVAYALACFAKTVEPVLINFGIAGHQNQALGELYWVDKIVDADTGKCFYPPLLIKPPCQRCELTSYSKPVQDYQRTGLYDMEASAFYETATRFSTGELIQCLKIVSDNAQNPAAQITESQVVAWIVEQLPTLDQAIAQLRRLHQHLAHPVLTLLPDLTARYHFTASYEQQLKSLLNRWQLINPDGLAFVPLDEFKNAKQLLAWLEQSLERQDFYL